MPDYNQTYHSEIEESARRSAEVVIRLLIRLFAPQSVVDVGCGRGTWLAEWQRQGIPDILGVDGGGQEVSRLLIPEHLFQEYDLNTPFHATRRFDLATCLEVAEHLHPTSADTLVSTLTGLSDVVVFGAAVPRQGGFRHLNEQWPAYWAARFEAAGYVFADGLRWHLMPDESVAWWYRQNTFLAIRKDVYEQHYHQFPRFSPHFYVMHELVYRNYASLPHRLFFGAEQVLYNHFHGLYHRLLPTARKLLKKP